MLSGDSYLVERPRLPLAGVWMYYTPENLTKTPKIRCQAYESAQNKMPDEHGHRKIISWCSLTTTMHYLQKKTKNCFFWATLLGLRGNVCSPSTARWKAHARLPIRHNWTFFTISYGWDVISRNLSKSACFKGGGSVWVQISNTRGRRPPTSLLVSENKSDCPFVWYQNPQSIVWFCHKARVCDGQTDGQTELRQLIPR